MRISMDSTFILHFEHMEGFENFNARIDDVPHSARSDVVSGVVHCAWKASDIR